MNAPDTNPGVGAAEEIWTSPLSADTKRMLQPVANPPMIATQLETAGGRADRTRCVTAERNDPDVLADCRIAQRKARRAPVRVRDTRRRRVRDAWTDPLPLLRGPRIYHYRDLTAWSAS